MFRVTALVSTRNAARWLPTRLDNLLGQTLADRLEVVVIDSGSQQNESEIVRDYQSRYPNLVGLRTPPEGLYAAWNRGLGLARGAYLTSANTDDRLCPHALERLACTLDEQVEVGLVYANYWECNDAEAVLGWDGHSPGVRLVRPGAFSRRRLAMRCLCGPQPMWRASLHREIGLFDESFQVCGDWDFWLRVAEVRPLFHLDEPLGLYLRNPEGLEHSAPDRALRESQSIRERFLQQSASKNRLLQVHDDLGPA